MNFVVIGASRGLGFCLVKRLLEEGHTVAAGARSPTKALRDLIAGYGDRARLWPADVTDEEQMTAMAREAKDFLGKIDSLCNVAGVLLNTDRTKPLHQCDIDEFRRTLNVNSVGPVVVVKAFFPYLEDGATVFTVTSEGVGVHCCGSWIPCYALSKTVATKVSGVLNASVPNMDFYSVHPGRMNTDMGRGTAQIEPEEAAEGFWRLMTGQTPISRKTWYIDYNGDPMEM